MLHVIKKEQMSWKLGSVNGVKVVLFLIGDSKNLLLFAGLGLGCWGVLNGGSFTFTLPLLFLSRNFLISLFPFPPFADIHPLLDFLYLCFS